MKFLRRLFRRRLAEDGWCKPCSHRSVCDMSSRCGRRWL